MVGGVTGLERRRGWASRVAREGTVGRGQASHVAARGCTVSSLHTEGRPSET